MRFLLLFCLFPFLSFSQDSLNMSVLGYVDYPNTKGIDIWGWVDSSGSEFAIVGLRDGVSVVGGGTPSRANASYWNGELPWATVTDMNQVRMSSTVETITQLGLDESSSNLIPKGTVIVATRVGLGKISMPTIDVCINQDLKALAPISADIISTEYLFSVMQSNSPLIESMGTGATVKGIRLGQLNSLRIPLPPIAEQQRITERLNRAEEINKTNADSNKKIEELKSSLLQRAFRGEL